MPTRSPSPLRDEIARAFPDRPFTVQFWDGSELPATNGAGPVFRLRSRKAVAHALRAPGQLGIWRAAPTLDEAQTTKLDMVCQKLALQPGERVLDVGCGWGSFVIHAAREYGVRVTGITLSEPQARLARERAAEAGLADQVDIRVADYREMRGERFDAIASIGMA